MPNPAPALGLPAGQRPASVHVTFPAGRSGREGHAGPAFSSIIVLLHRKGSGRERPDVGGVAADRRLVPF